MALRELRGVFVASAGYMFRRRATWLVLAGLVLVLSVPAVSSYGQLRDLRHFRRLAEKGEINPDLPAVCDPEGDGLCWGISEAGPPDRVLTDAERRDAVERLRPVAITQFTQLVSEAEQELVPSAVAATRAKSLGTGFGVMFAILLGATLVGAEWRWGVWRQQLPHQPRRVLLVIGKFAALWAAVVLVASATFLAVALVDLGMRIIDNVPSRTGPSVVAVLGDLMKAFLSLGVYATLAAGAATLFRSSLAGLAAPLFVLGVDGWLARGTGIFRHVFPAQQVVGLFPPEDIRQIAEGAPWWGPSTGPRCVRGVCFNSPLPYIPTGRAALVLSAWIIGIVVLTAVRVHRQDVGSGS